jgi:alpha/beta hydrolase fold
VPLDYDRPKGRQITLALTRLPAGDPSRRIGSLFINPGRPGGSGVEFVQGAGPFLYSDEVRARFDLVGFDPRGVIGSTPLRCYETFEDALAVTYAELIGATLGVLYDPSVWPLWAEILQQLYELTSPAAAAADLEALRARLGGAFQQEDYPNFIEGFPGVACTGRSPSTGCCRGRGCSPWPAGATPRCSPRPASTAEHLPAHHAGPATGHGVSPTRMLDG